MLGFSHLSSRICSPRGRQNSPVQAFLLSHLSAGNGTVEKTAHIFSTLVSNKIYRTPSFVHFSRKMEDRAFFFFFLLGNYRRRRSHHFHFLTIISLYTLLSPPRDNGPSRRGITFQSVFLCHRSNSPIDGERHCRGHGARLRRHFPGRNPVEIGANAWVRGIVGRCLLHNTCDIYWRAF